MTPSFLETNQMRPCQSGSADEMRWFVAEHLREVVVGDLDELAAVVADGEAHQVARLGRAPDAVLAVEEEVAAAREVLEELACRAGRARRACHRSRGPRASSGRTRGPAGRRTSTGRSRRSGRPCRTRASRTATARGAGLRLQVAADRAGVLVGVGHPRVVVDVAGGVGRHERVLRRDRRRASAAAGGRRGGGRQRGHGCPFWTGVAANAAAAVMPSAQAASAVAQHVEFGGCHRTPEVAWCRDVRQWSGRRAPSAHLCVHDIAPVRAPERAEVNTRVVSA